MTNILHVPVKIHHFVRQRRIVGVSIIPSTHGIYHGPGAKTFAASDFNEI
jgi:hypothetical protein